MDPVLKFVTIIHVVYDYSCADLLTVSQYQVNRWGVVLMDGVLSEFGSLPYTHMTIVTLNVFIK